MTRIPGLFVFVLLVSAVELAGQTGDPNSDRAPGPISIEGSVTHAVTGEPLPWVRITLEPLEDTPGGPREERSGADGEFELESVELGSYTLVAEATGFTGLRRVQRLYESGRVDLEIELWPAAFGLEPIVVTATRLRWLEERGFYERREGGMGITLDRAEIESRRSQLVSDLLLGVPGVRVISGRAGNRPARVLLRGGCRPQIVLDGAPFSTAADISIDRVVSMGEVEAIEVYHGSTDPTRFSTSACGTILVWTRRSTGSGAPLSWERLLAAAGVLVMFVFSVR